MYWLTCCFKNKAYHLHNEFSKRYRLCCLSHNGQQVGKNIVICISGNWCSERRRNLSRDGQEQSDQEPCLSCSKVELLPPHPVPLDLGLTYWWIPHIAINSMPEAGVHEGSKEQDRHQLAFTELRVHNEPDNAMLWGLRTGEQAGRLPGGRCIYFQSWRGVGVILVKKRGEGSDRKAKERYSRPRE